MANKIYPKAFERAMKGGLALDSADIKCVAVDLADYTYSDAHEFLSDVPAPARVATSGNLASKTIATVTSDDVRFDAADFAFTAVTGDQFEALIYYVDTGVAGTSYLLCFKDTGITGAPFTPSGSDINVTIPANGILEWRN